MRDASRHIPTAAKICACTTLLQEGYGILRNRADIASERPHSAFGIPLELEQERTQPPLGRGGGGWPQDSMINLRHLSSGSCVSGVMPNNGFH